MLGKGVRGVSFGAERLTLSNNNNLSKREGEEGERRSEPKIIGKVRGSIVAV